MCKMHHTSQIGSAEADEARKNGSCTNHSVLNSNSNQHGFNFMRENSNY